MTDETHVPEPQEDRPPAPDPPDQGATEAAPAATEPASDSDFSGGEGMVAVAGLILIVVWLIFEVILSEYGMPTIAILFAVAAAALPRLNRDSVEKVHRLNVLMKIIGYGLAVIGLTEIIFDLREGVLEDFVTVVGALGAYAAYLMALLGARSIKL